MPRVPSSTPRTDIVWLDLDDPPEALRRRITETVHSWVPVCRGELDHLVGVAHAKDLLVPLLTGQLGPPGANTLIPGWA